MAPPPSRTTTENSYAFICGFFFKMVDFFLHFFFCWHWRHFVNKCQLLSPALPKKKPKRKNTNCGNGCWLIEGYVQQWQQQKKRRVNDVATCFSLAAPMMMADWLPYAGCGSAFPLPIYPSSHCGYCSSGCSHKRLQLHAKCASVCACVSVCVSDYEYLGLPLRRSTSKMAAAAAAVAVAVEFCRR